MPPVLFRTLTRLSPDTSQKLPGNILETSWKLAKILDTSHIFFEHFPAISWTHSRFSPSISETLPECFLQTTPHIQTCKLSEHYPHKKDTTWTLSRHKLFPHLISTLHIQIFSTYSQLFHPVAQLNLRFWTNSGLVWNKDYKNVKIVLIFCLRYGTVSLFHRNIRTL